MCCVNLKSRDTHLNIQCMQCPTDSIYTYLCIGKHCACCMTGLARSHSQILYTYCRVSPYEGTDDGGIHVKLRFVKNESTTDTVPVKKKAPYLHNCNYQIQYRVTIKCNYTTLQCT